MHYILLKGSDDQSRVAVSQELKRLRKRVKELEEEIEEVKGQYDYECECNKQFVACQKENAELKKQLEIFKLSNEALQQDNLDLSYDKVDLAYEYAQEMAENWKKEYEKEIAELKNQIEQMAKDYTSEIAYYIGASENRMAVEELKKLKSKIEKIVYSPNKCLNKEDTINDFIEIIENQIKQLKGEDNENI